MQIIPLRPNDRLRLKKPHPCGNSIFFVLRVGSEVRVKCEGCGRDMTIDRLKLEKSIKRILTDTDPDNQQEKGSDKTV